MHQYTGKIHVASSMRQRCTIMRGKHACKQYNAVVSKSYASKVHHYAGDYAAILYNVSSHNGACTVTRVNWCMHF